MPINGDGGNNTLTGNIFVNTINGFGGNDTIDGRDSADTLNGGLGNDIFRYISASHLDAGETVNGGSGHDKLLMTVAGIYNFQIANLTGLEEVEFGGGNVTEARFHSSQLGSGLSATAVIDGFSATGIKDNLVFRMNTTSLNISNLVFQQWDEVDDRVYIDGSGANNSIIGSDVDDNIYGYGGNDFISGHLGADKLFGGSGNDTFSYYSTNEVESGEIIFGQTGFDKIQIRNGGTFNFTTATLNSIEEIEFGTTHDNTVTINSSQLGAELSSTARIDSAGALGAENEFRVHVNTLTTDLRGLTFQDWVEADDDIVVIGNGISNTVHGSSVDDVVYGYAGNDVLRGYDGNDSLTGGTGIDRLEGGNGNDTLRGDRGRDSLYGGSGNDAFQYYAVNQLETAEIISGQTGFDKIEIVNDGIFNFSITSLSSIEEIEFRGNYDNVAIIASSQLGVGLSHSAVIDSFGGIGAQNELRVHVNTATTDLRSLTFQDWVEADDSVVVIGNGFSNTIYGTSVDDKLFGFAGNDNLYGYNGDDRLNGGTGDDRLDGGDGVDILRGERGVDRLFGGSGNDVFEYYATNEVEAGESILGQTGFDRIDILNAGIFDFSTASLISIEEIEFRTTHDNVAMINSSQLGVGLSSTARIDSHGGAGAQNELRVNVNTTTTDLRGLTFQNWVVADDDVVVNGDGGSNIVYGSSVNDTVYGNVGNDILYGYGGDDRLFGGNGNDRLDTGGGTNTAIGGRGNDIVYGGTGIDTIYGNVGTDRLYGYDGDDVISGGGWIDRVYGGDGDDTIHGNFGNDLLYGEAGNDFITGGYGQDTIHGGAGDDDLYGGGFADTLYGNIGEDRIFGGGGNDTVYGGDGRDIIRGEGGNDILYGNSDADDLFGGAGSDTLNGGHGNDWMWGGDGVVGDGTLDRFVFASTIGHDRIHDFENGIDRIDFSGNATFNNFATVSANAAQSGSDVIITQDASNSIRIDDMNLADLDASDFIF